jgi:uncharacterized repeat protein (TIGR01451 family)
MGRLRAHGVGLLAVLALAGPGAGGASAQQPPDPDGQGSDYFVTIVARQCPTYDDITANRARNNIQESLKDLGANTPYTAGQPISPAIEDAAQPNCTPITGWKFTQGRGIGGPVLGPWGGLSIVTQPFTSPDITTLASIPDRDNSGRILPGTSIGGATTIELTSTQATLARTSSSLWIQGGTPSDPILAGIPAFADEFGFGALRCAIDNLNGDNVEWIQFPTGSRHVYCYAYYVTPPPTSGTIIVRKQVSDPPNADQTFVFEGNISYTTDKRFSLRVNNGNVPAATFYRAATGPGDDLWTVRELVPDGWDLTGLTCTSRNSTVTTDLATAAVTIRLVAGDTVNCLFTDALRPPPGQLFISKVTFGGVGRFPFRVEPAGGGDVLRTAATTTDPGTPASADPGPFTLDPGSYDIAERLPRARGGRWRQTSVNCSAVLKHSRGRAAPPATRVTIHSDAGVACVFTNRFIPNGSIRILKETRGAGGTTGFVISPVANPERQYTQTATTSGSGDIARARGDATNRLRLGRYVIQETGTQSGDKGRWTLVAVTCNDRLLGFAQGQVAIRLTTDNPRAVCHFINAFTPDVDPVPPDPDPNPPDPSPPPPQTDLVVTKRALENRVDFGDIARFRITVRNAGPVAAEQVVVADDPGPNAQLVSAKPSKGACNERLPLICKIGALDPGETATVLVRVRAVGTPRISNLAVAGSATPETTLDNNSDRDSVRVRSQGGTLGQIENRREACPASVVAHMAC